MNDSDLMYIKTIVETKNISQAAKKLFISQPSLSRTLQKMESEIGTPLFNRTKIGMVPTDAGLEFYKCACNMINIYENFKVNVSFLNNLNKGKITIGITSFLGTKLLPSILPKYHKLFPNIKINIVESNTTALEKQIEEGNLDFAIMHSTNVEDSTFKHYEILQKDHFLLMTSKDNEIKNIANTNDSLPYYEINLDQLENLEFVGYRENKRMREVFDNIFKTAEFRPNVIVELTNYQTATRLVAQGMGVTIIARNYLDIFKEYLPVDYYRIKNVNDTWYTVVVKNPNINLSRPAFEFIKLLKELYDVESGEVIKS